MLADNESRCGLEFILKIDLYRFVSNRDFIFIHTEQRQRLAKTEIETSIATLRPLSRFHCIRIF